MTTPPIMYGPFSVLRTPTAYAIVNRQSASPFPIITFPVVDGYWLGPFKAACQTAAELLETYKHNRESGTLAQPPSSRVSGGPAPLRGCSGVGPEVDDKEEIRAVLGWVEKKEDGNER